MLYPGPFVMLTGSGRMVTSMYKASNKKFFNAGDKRASNSTEEVGDTLPSASILYSPEPTLTLGSLRVIVRMRFQTALVAASLAAVAQAHFQLQYPPPRGAFVEDGKL
jgi:hypothetical protein